MPLSPQSHHSHWPSFLPAPQIYSCLLAFASFFCLPRPGTGFKVTSQGRPSKPFQLKQRAYMAPHTLQQSPLSPWHLSLYEFINCFMVIVCLHSLEWRLPEGRNFILFIPPTLAPRTAPGTKKVLKTCAWTIRRWISQRPPWDQALRQISSHGLLASALLCISHLLHCKSFLSKSSPACILCVLLLRVYYHSGWCVPSNGNDQWDACICMFMTNHAGLG